MNNYKTEKNDLIKLASVQQSAASNPLFSTWVEASAGTGKTKVLSDRVLRLLLSKVKPEKILCLTYTKAAAVEMNERIAKRLSLWAIEDEDELINELKKLLGNECNEKELPELMRFARTLFASLLDTPGGMKIQTIHSFCQDILKRFPLEAGVSPYFEVMDTRSSKEILQNIKIELLQQMEFGFSDSLTEALFYLIHNVSEYKFPEIMNMITENRNKIDMLLRKYGGNIDNIRLALEKKLNLNIDTSIDDIKKDFFDGIDLKNIKNAFEALSEGGKEDKQKAETFIQIAENNFDIKDYDFYKTIFLTQSGTIKARLVSKKVQEKHESILTFLQKEACRLLENENRIAALSVLKSTYYILITAKNIIDRYNKHKEVFSILDYEDLIVITRSLLENQDVTDWVLFKLDGGIEHILIDEAQDTSPNQWAIVRALTTEFFAGNGIHESALDRTVFVVGDRKQSIYSFQGADPNEFDKMYHYFEERAQNFKKVHLDVSFRSTKAVMDCVNLLFEAEDAKKGVIPVGEHINHRPFRLGDGGKVEILPLLCAEDDTNNDAYNWVLPIGCEQKTSISSQLARMIATNIKQMVENKEILASQNRPIRYGDFMFLVQQRKSFVEEFVRACKDLGVSVAGVDKLKLLEQIVVQDLISLGKFLLLPSDDLSLAEALKSPIFGLNDDDLFTLCYKRDGSLFNNLLKNNNYSETADKLKLLLNMTGFVRPFELFNYILSILDGRKNFIRRMGNDVEDVLDEFLNLTIVFEQTHTPSLQDFITWIVKDEVIVQKEMEQGDSDTVKIMTVHGSKGLQAPIVILADTTKIKNKAQKSEFLWDDDLVYFPASSDCYDENCKRIKAQNLEADFEEYRRLLYVALTRAEDRLYIAGFSKNKEADSDSWFSLLRNNLSSNVVLNNDDKRIVYEVPQENIFTDIKIIQPATKEYVDYSFLLTSAPQENPLAKPYAPSRDDNDETEIASSPLLEKGNFYRRGTVMHKLLQFICTIDVNDREDAIWSFLEKNLQDFSYAEKQKIVVEILRLCDAYPEIFKTNSFAEVPIIGEVDGKIISAKIDRLIIDDDKVIVVDYKTNRPAAEKFSDIPDIYLKQLRDYKALLKKIYPEKEVLTYLLWTNTCNMMKV